MKKVLRNSVFVLAAALAMIQFGDNSITKDTHFIEEASSNQSVGAQSVKKLIGSDETIEYSKIYTQLGHDGSNYFLRFAMAVSGNINSISYSLDINDVHYELGDKIVSTLYRSISANGTNYYYSENLNSITEDKTEASSDYLWSCYTIKFKDELHTYSSLALTPSINGEILDNKIISLQDEINGSYTYTFGNLDLANVGLEKDNYSYNQTMNIVK